MTDYNPSSNYTIWFANSDGKVNRLLADAVSFSYTKVLGDVGVLQLSLPDFPNELLKTNSQIHLYRSDAEGADHLDFFGFLKGWTQRSSGGERTTTLVFVDQHDLLKRKIIAYTGSTIYTKMGDYADDVMKQIVRYNLGSSAVNAERDLSQFIDFTVDPDTSKGPLIVKEDMAYANVLKTLKEIQEMSRSKGDETLFKIDVAITDGPERSMSFVFRTAQKSFATDSSWQQSGSAGNLVIFSEEHGNLLDPSLEFSSFDSINIAYVGGPGVGSNRKLYEVTTTEIDNGTTKGIPRMEGFVNAQDGQMTDTADYQLLGHTLLVESKPKTIFRGTLIDGLHGPYKVAWDLGSIVSVSYQDSMYKVLVRGVSVGLSGSHEESITVVAETIL